MTQTDLTNKTWLFHEDPGHGWLEVTRDEVRALNIQTGISGYSYEKDETIYLEEDCDYNLFATAWEKATGMKWDHGTRTKTVHEDPTPIRNYMHYERPKNRRKINEEQMNRVMDYGMETSDADPGL